VKAQSEARAHLCKLCLRAVGKPTKQDQNLEQSVAVYSASVKVVSRSSGRSATAAAAYRIAEKITDHRTGEIYDFTRKHGVQGVSMHLPFGLPLMTSEALWNAAEFAEKRKNSTVARELLVALPFELMSDQRMTLANSIAIELVERYQVATQVAVHLPDRDGDNRNHHAHILFSTRRLTLAGFGEKTRELDDLKSGPAEVLWVREMVERCTNKALADAGYNVRVDHRSLADQRTVALEAGNPALAHVLDRAPTVHEGPRVTQIRRECARFNRQPMGQLDRMAANDDIRQVQVSRLELAVVEAQIIDLETERTKRREQAFMQRSHWLRQELTHIEASTMSPGDIERRVASRLEERLAEAHTGLLISSSYLGDVDWLAKLWRGELLRYLQSSPVMPPSESRRLADMLSFPLPDDEALRRQWWWKLLQDMREAEDIALSMAERGADSFGITMHGDETLAPFDTWDSIRRDRLEVIESTLRLVQRSRLQSEDVRTMTIALEGLLNDVRTLIPGDIERMRENAVLEQQELSRVAQWLEEQLDTESLKPRGPRIG
jgi:hypothetical protein